MDIASRNRNLAGERGWVILTLTNTPMDKLHNSAPKIHVNTRHAKGVE